MKPIHVGTIVGTHGIKGHVLVNSYTDPDINITKIPVFSNKKEVIQITFIKRSNKNHLICKVNNIIDRNFALTLKNTELYCNRADLPKLSCLDEYYVADLKGLQVILENTEEVIGIIKNVHNFGAGDIIEIQFNDKKIEFYPFLEKFFPVINPNYVILTNRLNF